MLGEDIANVQTARRNGQLDLDVFYRGDPHMQVNIRSIGEGNYKLVIGHDDDIGEIDEFHLLREAYRNAIYRHGGKAYRVKDVIRGKRKVILVREYSWNETRAFVSKKIRLKRRYRVVDYANVMLATVNIDVTEFLVNVTEKDRSGKVVNSWNGNMGMPTHTLPSEATLLRFRKPLWEQLVRQLGHQGSRSALESCERLLWGLFPTVSGPCDKQDFSSASEVEADGTASIYLYDMVYDGVGLTMLACVRMVELVDKAIERLQQCECETDQGCFRCIAHPLSSETSSKLATLRMLKRLRNEFNGSFEVTQNNNESLLHDVPRVLPCSACDAPVKVGDRFCSNCGEKQAS